MSKGKGKNKNRLGIAPVIVGDRNAIAAHVTVRVPWTEGELLEVTAAGSAKREKGDRHQRGIGVALALARAMRHAANVLEQTAMLQVRSAELAKVSENARREMQRMMRALPRQGLTTAEVREKYGEDAAKRHRERKNARQDQEVTRGNSDA